MPVIEGGKTMAVAFDGEVAASSGETDSNTWICSECRSRESEMLSKLALLESVVQPV